MTLDREMLATDLADILSNAHGIDVDSNDVKRGLDDFLKAIQPVGPTKAAARVAEFLRQFDEARGHRTDEYRDQVAQIAGDQNTTVLSADDLRALVRAVGVEVYMDSLREQLTANKRDTAGA